jgi:hypothetical protein
MFSLSRQSLAKGFATDRDEARETARRQFAISAAIVFALLFAAIVTVGRDAVGRPAPIPVAATANHVSSPPIQTSVRYVDRSSPTHRIAVASSRD